VLAVPGWDERRLPQQGHLLLRQNFVGSRRSRSVVAPPPSSGAATGASAATPKSALAPVADLFPRANAMRLLQSAPLKAPPQPLRAKHGIGGGPAPSSA